jgi:uncharacterized membrane-anchored protein YjiN (DUF445 family)
MRRVATGLLVCAALVYAAAVALEPRYPWLYYVAATSEAAMVGAIADWFAVVALFRHPLGLRFIPHTAIVPRNKQRIAQGISEFIQQHFLSAPALVERIARLKPAHSLANWLATPANAEQLAAYAVRLISFGLGVLDDARLRRFLQEAISAKLRQADIAAAAAQLLDVLTEAGRHHELFDAALGTLDELLAREETRAMIAREVAANAPLVKAISDLLHLRLDERAALKIVDAAVRRIAQVRADRDHELRRRFDEFVAGFIARLKQDPATRSRVAQLRDEALASPSLARYLESLWDELREWLRADLARRPSQVHERLVRLAGRQGAELARDPAILEWVDAQILAAVPPLVAEHRAAIGRFIEEQVNGWQEEKLVVELERHLGPDLQYIRINGTLVGGLAGLAIAIATRLAQ